MLNQGLSDHRARAAWLPVVSRILGVLPVFVGTAVLTAIIFRLGGIEAAGTAAAIFAGALASALGVLSQARWWGRRGTSPVLFMGTSALFAVASVRALQAGGVDLLGVLLVASAPVLLLCAWILPTLLPRIPPFMAGMALLYVTERFASKITLPTLSSASIDTTSEQIAFIATLGVTLGLWFRGAVALRPWALLIGLVAGSFLILVLDGIDLQPIRGVDWFGLPEANRPVPGLPSIADIVALLPVFCVLSLLAAIESASVGSAVWSRIARTGPTVYQSLVQRGLRVQALAHLASSLLGGAPLTVANSASATPSSSLRWRGNSFPAAGAAALLIALAFMPKLAALLLAVPPTVFAACSAVLLLILVQRALTIIFSQPVRVEHAAGFALLIGTVLIVPGGAVSIQVPAFAGIQAQGVAIPAGALSTLLLAAMLVVVRLRKVRFKTALDLSSLDPIQEAAVRRAEKRGWSAEECSRLELAIEEALTWLIDQSPRRKPPALLVVEVESRRDEVILNLITKRAGSAPVSVEDSDTDDHALISALPLQLLEATADRVEHYRYERGDRLKVAMRPRPSSVERASGRPQRWWQSWARG